MFSFRIKKKNTKNQSELFIDKKNNKVVAKVLFNKKNPYRPAKLLNKNPKLSKEINNDMNIKNELFINDQINHKNISKLIGFLKLEDYTILAIEYAQLGDLNRFKNVNIQDKQISETFLGYITVQIIEDLKVFKENKILHLDIKPGNVLINDKLEIKVCDFSVSRSYKFLIGKKDKITLPCVGTYQ